jgi:DNA-binding MarR family transcriptional regulator
MEDREQSLLLRITTIARTVRNRFDRRARTIGVTRAQWRMIATIHLAAGSTQREIAELLEVREITAGRHIDKLCEQGWAERRVDLADRRVHRVYLTPQAAPLLVELSKLGEAEKAQALDGFSSDEVAVFEAFLSRMAVNLESPMGFSDPIGDSEE